MVEVHEAGTRPWRYQVLVPQGDDFLCKLVAMDVWLQRWKIMYRAVSVEQDDGAVRVCFREESVAHAFYEILGGELVPPDAQTLALAAEPINDVSQAALATS